MIKGVIKDIGVDSSGNVRVVTDYYEDGKLVHADGVTRFSWAVTPTKEEMLVKIDKEVKDHAEYLMRRPVIKQENEKIVSELQPTILGREVVLTETKIVSDSKIITVDGKKVVSTVDKP